MLQTLRKTFANAHIFPAYSSPGVLSQLRFQSMTISIRLRKVRETRCVHSGTSNDFLDINHRNDSCLRRRHYRLDVRTFRYESSSLNTMDSNLTHVHEPRATRLELA